jgi:gamma-glutamylcyclotransferase (GGCT)/AIG2-like uncharacterized protein YtfP
MDLPYFAYGSNLSLARMRQRCPGCADRGEAWLAGWRLTFAGRSRLWGGGGVATLAPEPGGLIYGWLYEVPPQDLFTLDAVEGHPTFYRRVQLRVQTPRGVRPAWIYLLPPEQAERPPSEDYRQAVAAAYRSRALPLPPALEAPEGSGEGA